MPTETSPTLKMNTSHDPATRTSPDAEREKTPLDPPLPRATVPSGCAVVDMGLLKPGNAGYPNE